MGSGMRVISGYAIQPAQNPHHETGSANFAARAACCIYAIDVMNNRVITLLHEEEFDSIISSGNVLVDFYADWCEPCKWLDPILKDVMVRIGIPLTVLKVNSDLFLPLTQKFQLRSVPVLMFFVDNQLKWRMNGFLVADEMIRVLEDVSREKGDQ
jgi:thioredoxin 1